jgi:16S rRNA (guanine527-N7)-methyltransferase
MSAARAALETIGAEPAAREALAGYVRLLLERNATLNLTAARDEAAVTEHIRDALSLLPYVRDPLVDVGSGGGFPAIPLAIVTGFRVTLVESLAKKARFLEEAVAELGLDATVVCERAEVAARRPDLRGAFASATARAVGSLPTVLELSVPFLAVGGVAVLQRGRIEPAERSAADDAALVLGAEVSAETVLEGERRVLLAVKLRETPQRFPRRPGVPAKRPLCLPRGGDGADGADG